MVYKKVGIVPKIIIWTVIGLVFLLVMPAAIGVVWAPGCEGCHAIEVEKLETASHADLSCRDCHQSSSNFGGIGMNHRVWYGMILHIIPRPDAANTVQNDTCNVCHASVSSDGKVILNRGLRVNHEACAAGRRCVVCHGGVGHPGSVGWVSRYEMDKCIECHDNVQNKDLTQCDICHVGRMITNRADRNNNTVFSIVHGSGWKESHGLGDWNTCSPCHTSAMCGSCHGPLVPHDNLIINTHGRPAKEVDNKCGGCHRDEEFCNSCHGMEMPHPQSFLIEHADETNKYGEDACLRCHIIKDCNDCHNGHVHPGGPKLWNR